MEFGACLNDWKQAKRAPLLERKLCLRKESALLGLVFGVRVWGLEFRDSGLGVSGSGVRFPRASGESRE